MPHMNNDDYEKYPSGVPACHRYFKPFIQLHHKIRNFCSKFLIQMYNIKDDKEVVSKTTSKEISQNIKDFPNCSKKTEPLDANDNKIITESKPTLRNNAKLKHLKCCQEQEMTSHHEEIIKFIHNSWLLLSEEGDSQLSTQSNDSKNIPDNHSTLYYVDGPRPHLQDFKPFQLELWWGRRLYNLVTKPA